MCLITFAYRYHARLPLVIAANRDEFHSRPTRDACFWPAGQSHPGLLAGQDLTQGGTWLGLTRHGRFAAVTNFRNSGSASGALSRGALTRDFLLGHMPPGDYLATVQDSLASYAGFNLLAGDHRSLFYLNSVSAQVTELQPGVYGLSNAELDAGWPKIRNSKAALQNLLDHHAEISTDQLATIMLDRAPAPDEELPATGIPLELERSLSSRFIMNTQRDYGTRCTTCILIDDQGNARFSEQNYGPDSRIRTRRYFHFPLADV